MVDAEVDRLAPAYWTGNGHKWLCGPKGSAVLWARADRRAEVRPLVISHGWNDDRVTRGELTAFRARFDWLGTSDPTPYLALADAVRIVGGLAPGGWAGLTTANHRLVVDGRAMLSAALDVPPVAPDELSGSMAAVPVPGLKTDADAEALHRALREDGFEVPVLGWPVAAARAAGRNPDAVLLRISAQLYNEPADYERLAGALNRHLVRPVAR
jgi:isopenicillin-N epimerase